MKATSGAHQHRSRFNMPYVAILLAWMKKALMFVLFLIFVLKIRKLFIM
jgi:hypothetical protein